MPVYSVKLNHVSTLSVHLRTDPQAFSRPSKVQGLNLFVQGSDCIKSFIAMQTCMTANPEAFVKYGDESDRNNSTAEGGFKSQPGDKQDEPPLVSPPAGAVRNPIS